MRKLLGGSFCHPLRAAITGEPTIHIRAHRRGTGRSPEAEAEAEAGNSVVVTTIHGLSQSKRAPHLRISAGDFPRQMMRLLTEKLDCRGSVVEDPVTGPVVYLEGDRRVIVGNWLAYGLDGPWIELARIKVHFTVAERWGFNNGRSWRNIYPSWIRGNGIRRLRS